jgi:hypothetical protein
MSVRPPVVRIIPFIPCNRIIYTLIFRVVFGLHFVLQTHPYQVCLMMFVFLGSEFCLKLPSDSTSRWTPLLSTNGWQLHTPIVDLHHLVIIHARHTTSRKIGINSLSVLSHHPAYGSVQGGFLTYTLTDPK